MAFSPRSLACAALTLITAAAATPAVAAPPGPTAYRPFEISAPMDPKNEPQNSQVAYSGQFPAWQFTDVGREAIEPTIGIDKQGVAFFPASTFEEPANGAGGHPYLMRSTDGGKTWQTIEPATEVGEDPPRDLDPFVYTDPQTNRTFDVGLLLAGSYLSYSDDKGENWKSTFASDPGVNDHQSITSGPPPALDPGVTPLSPDYPEIVYYCVNQVSKSSCSASRDGGRTWLPTGGAAYAGVTENGTEGEFPICSGLTGHAQTDKQGRLFLPAGHCFNPYVAVSEDGGKSFQRYRVSRTVDAAQPHTEMAVDDAGNLYYVWIDGVHHLPFLAISRDHGKTWGKPLMIAPPDTYSANLPTVVAGEAGRIAITFAGSTVKDETANRRPWNSYMITSTDALAERPVFLSTTANRTGDPIHRGAACLGRCGGMFDFIDIQLSPSDATVWATTSDSCTAKDKCNSKYDATDKDFPKSPATDRRGIAIRQLAGDKLAGPLDTASTQATAETRSQPAPEPRLVPVTVGSTGRQGPQIRRFDITCSTLVRASRRSKTKPLRAPRCRRTRVVRRVSGKERQSVLPRFRYDLTEAATVSLRIEKLGKKRGRAQTLRSSAAAGLNRLLFVGRFNGRALSVGRYRVTLVAVDSSGKVSPSRSLEFRVR